MHVYVALVKGKLMPSATFSRKLIERLALIYNPGALQDEIDIRRVELVPDDEDA